MSQIKHILWDWNGTLLDDTQAALDTLNIMLKERGAQEIGMEFYRENFSFPVRPFYEKIGMILENEDWDALAQEYHDVYGEQSKRLNEEAIAALDKVRASGVSQSIVSALRQDLLEQAMVEYGIVDYFDYVYGVDNLDGASKLGRARELMAVIRNHCECSEIAMIGDAFHDKEVADDLGIGCVLCGQGSHAAWRLEKVAPTGATLLEAVSLVLGS